jgi:hypothetical protein
MPAGVSAYTALANVTLGSNANSVSFSSVGQGYRDLVLVVTGVPTTAEQFFYLYFNSDTGSNYSRLEMLGTGSTPATFTAANLIPITLNASNVGTNIIQIMDYSATDKHKSVLYRSANPSSNTLMGAGRWANTAAVTTVTITGFNAGQMAAGTTLALYGVSS